MGEETGGVAGAASWSAASQSSATTVDPAMELPVLRTEAHGRPIYGKFFPNLVKVFSLRQ